MVYESARKFRALASEMIKPGHRSQVDDPVVGQGESSGVKKLTPGTYTIEVDDDGYSPRPRFSSSPIPMTWKED